MLLVPKRRGSEVGIVATLQALALAVFLLGIYPQGTVTWEDDLAGRKNSLITTADYIETVSLSQDANALDGQQSEGILGIDAFDVSETDHGVLLNLSYSQLIYQSANFGFSLIRSPPLGSPV